MKKLKWALVRFFFPGRLWPCKSVELDKMGLGDVWWKLTTQDVTYLKAGNNLVYIKRGK